MIKVFTEEQNIDLDFFLIDSIAIWILSCITVSHSAWRGHKNKSQNKDLFKNKWNNRPGRSSNTQILTESNKPTKTVRDKDY